MIIDIVELEFKHDADINAQPNGENVALHLASQSDHAGVVKFLLEHKADVNKQNHCGSTALHRDHVVMW